MQCCIITDNNRISRDGIMMKIEVQLNNYYSQLVKMYKNQNQYQLHKRKQPQSDYQHFESDSYDEDNQITKVKIGKIPYSWYDDFKHFGYDNQLQPVFKQKQSNIIEQFINKSENKNWWKTIKDQLNLSNVVLTEAQLHLIQRIRSGKMASKTIATKDYHFESKYQDPFPLHSHPPSKRQFAPSKWQQMKVNKILDGLLTGRIKWNQQEQPKQKLYDAWEGNKLPQRGVINIAPMKTKLPQHNQSYNPPKEYLLSEEELKEWQELDEEDRPFNFVPASYDKIRRIPFYDQLIQERFQRCLDLYLCPRVKKKKLNIDPDSLLPKMPDPSSMKPFPTAVAITYEAHLHPVNCVCVSPSGDYLATGDSSGLFIIWEVLSSRPLLQLHYDNEPILSISWSKSNIVAFSHGRHLQIMVWKLNKSQKQSGESLIEQSKANNKLEKWQFYHSETQQYKNGLRVHFSFQNDVESIEIQRYKGDYFVTVVPNHTKKNQVIAIHRISKALSQTNIIKGKGIFKKVSFYPKKPQIVILTRAKVVVYSLEQMAIMKKLSTSTNVKSCMDVHPHGGYILVGSDDHKLFIYDIESGSKPFKTMNYHEEAVTTVAYHHNYPLMASASSDGTVHIFHFKNQTQTLQDPIIVPLKVLRGHKNVNNITFHPNQPWIFTVGNDHKVLLWT